MNSGVEAVVRAVIVLSLLPNIAVVQVSRCLYGSCSEFLIFLFVTSIVAVVNLNGVSFPGSG